MDNKIILHPLAVRLHKSRNLELESDGVKMLYHRFAHDSIEYCVGEFKKIIIDEIDATDSEYAHFVSIALESLKKRLDDLRISEYPDRTGRLPQRKSAQNP